ncbi:MAG: type II toxin-antitoxin system Phd/YefM family antitoxin [Methyloversatilis sp.]|jgi:antitoxin (DNA-binding transcriptional repressor) of toxin-antitoxin stability system|nr:type II toxin-antitoxin system Phd/YefM family antitoxin [Methyloversatilis sp.]
MSTEVSKSQFKARALEYFRDVERSGEPLIVTDRGEPRLEVRRFTRQERSPLDILRGSVLRYDRPTEPVGEDDWDAAR